MMKNRGILPTAILLTALSFGQAFTAGKPSTQAQQNAFVALDKVSAERIEVRQKSMATILDNQSTSRAWTIALLSTTAGLALGTSWYAYDQYMNPVRQPAPKPVNPPQKFKDLYYKRCLAEFEESQTVSGMVKQSVRNGFGYAVATIATIALVSSFNKMTNISLPAIRESLYPTTNDLYAAQEQVFKDSFDYVQKTLQDLANEQSKITTPEQLAVFEQWRSMLCTGLQTSIATLVKSVEDFAALSVEVATRAHKTLPKDHPALGEFSMLMRRVSILIDAINGLSSIIESTVNAADLATLNHNRMHVGMHFKNTIVTAREALHHVVMLVNAI